MASTGVTVEHYSRPEVKAAILGYCMNGAGARALNADEHWYKGGIDPKTVMLRGPADYDATIERGRTLYATLDILEQSVFEQAAPWDEATNAPETTLGDLSNCLAFTLSTDIDSIGDIRRDLSVKEAVEAAAQFHCDYLKERGIANSVYCLYSGGGIYVHLHHGLFAVDVGNTDLTPEDRKQESQVILKAYNRLIGDISKEFFRKYHQYIGKVKFDQLNNQKRTFKTIFSIHKRHPFAVIPLDPKNIKIDFKRASLPLSDEVLAEGANWYRNVDQSEKEPLVGLIHAHMEEVRKDTREHQAGNGDISRLPEPLEQANFAPCIKNIIEKAEAREGRHRALGILATYLYQMGWDEDAAFDLWSSIADRCRVEPRIFETTFGRISCPLCTTMQTDTGGYPNLNLFNMGFCVPDEICKGCQWPGDYHLQKILNEEQKPKGPTVIDAFKVMLEHDDEVKTDKGGSTWKWRVEKERIKRVVKFGKLSKAGEEKAHKFLENYKNILRTFGIDYDNLFPLVRVPKSNKEEFPHEIKAKALEILKTGNPVKYIADSCGKMVLGADKAFRKTICCISSQNINSSSGLHPKFSGDSGGGKTFIIYMFAHHMPKEAVIKGSMSAKAGFYHSDGNRVLRILDDYQAGNEELDTVIKQTSSEFHAPYQHRTVANHAAMTLEIGSEQTWAITSVDSSQEVQVLNRQLPINADDSIELTMEVNNLTIKRYCQGESQYPITATVLVSRCIMQILRDEGYIDVKIPFEERIEWLDTSNRRNPSIFMDLVIAHTAMNRYQRKKDADGFYLATDEDFLAAKALFTDNDAEELVKRLTARERDVIMLLTKNPEGLTRDDIAENLKIVPQRVTQILSGQKGQGGLKQKVQLRETKISEMITLSDDLRRTVHKTVYSLVDYDKFAGFEGVVRLKPTPTPPPKTAPKEPSKQSKHDASIAASMKTSNGSDVVSIVIEKEKEREERGGIEGLPHNGSEKIEGLLGNKEKAYFAYQKEPAIDQHTSGVTSESLPALVCANCGEDLTGKSKITKNGKIYCTQVGCGYPPREVKP